MSKYNTLWEYVLLSMKEQTVEFVKFISEN